jgi:predicted phage terminase large subunit-like protein
MTDLHSTFTSALRTPRRTLMALDRLEYEEDLLTFFKDAWPLIVGAKPYVPGWHLEAIAEHLMAVTRGTLGTQILIINIPPRMTKSSLVSVAWPAWMWALPPELVEGVLTTPFVGPQVQILSSSYGTMLSKRDTNRTRRLISSSWYQRLWGDRYHLMDDQNSKGRYDNDKGGYRLAVSEQSGLTGEGGDIITVDDPHNAVDVDSEAKRDSTIEWWDESMSTRLNDQDIGVYVAVMQRLYENDLTGHIISQNNSNNVTHLMLPMEYDSRRHCTTHIPWRSPATGLIEPFSDPRTEDGELLCEGRVSERALASLKVKLGPFGVAGQLQQAPTPRGGAILLEDYWQAWPPSVENVPEVPKMVWSEAEGKMVQAKATTTYPPVEFVLASVDTAMTDKTQNDFSAMTVWGLWYDQYQLPNLMLMEAWQERLQFNAMINKVMAVCKKRQVDRLLIEGKNNGIAAAQEIRRLTRGNEWSVIEEPVKGDKVGRAMACQPTFSAGQVWAPARNIDGNVVFYKFAQMVIDNCSIFPRGSTDDLTDTVTQAVNHFRRTGLLQTKGDRQDDLNRQALPPMERVAGKGQRLYGVL